MEQLASQFHYSIDLVSGEAKRDGQYDSIWSAPLQTLIRKSMYYYANSRSILIYHIAQTPKWITQYLQQNCTFHQ